MDLKVSLLKNIFSFVKTIKTEFVIFDTRDPSNLSVIAISKEKGDAMMISVPIEIQGSEIAPFSFNFSHIQKFLQTLNDDAILSFEINQSNVLSLKSDMGSRTIRLHIFSEEILNLEKIISQFGSLVSVQLKRDDLVKQISAALEIDGSTFDLRTRKDDPELLYVETKNIEEYFGRCHLMKHTEIADLKISLTRGVLTFLKSISESFVDLKMSKEHIEMTFQNPMFHVKYFDRTLLND